MDPRVFRAGSKPRDCRAAALRAWHAPLVSPGAIDLPDYAFAFHAGLMTRDPDGHALLLLEE